MFPFEESITNLHNMSTNHFLNSKKFVDADPQSLADDAGVDLETYSLASCGASEESSKNPTAQCAIMCAVKNACQEGGIAAKLLRSMRKGIAQLSDGHFASQEAPGKWAATSNPPTAYTLDMAAKIIAGDQEDITKGSTLWLGVASQNALHARRPDLYLKDANGIIADRAAAGYGTVWVPGVPNTVFFSKR